MLCYDSCLKCGEPMDYEIPAEDLWTKDHQVACQKCGALHDVLVHEDYDDETHEVWEYTSVVRHRGEEDV